MEVSGDAEHYERLNVDEHGKYRARKYDRTLGATFNQAAPPRSAEWPMPP